MADQDGDWLTVKEFSRLANLSESAIREAIRKNKLAFPVIRLTTGEKAPIRIVVPRNAA